MSTKGGECGDPLAGTTWPPSPVPNPGWFKGPWQGGCYCCDGGSGEMYNTCGEQGWGRFYMLNMDTHGDTHRCTHTHTNTHTYTHRWALGRMPLSAARFTDGHTEAQEDTTTYPKAEQQSQDPVSQPATVEGCACHGFLPQGLSSYRGHGHIRGRSHNSQTKQGPEVTQQCVPEGTLALSDPSQGTPLPTHDSGVPIRGGEQRPLLKCSGQARGWRTCGSLLSLGPGPPSLAL